MSDQFHPAFGEDERAALRIMLLQFVFKEPLNALRGLNRDAAEIVLAALRNVYRIHLDMQDMRLWALETILGADEAGAHIYRQFPELSDFEVAFIVNLGEGLPWITDWALPGSKRPRMTIVRPPAVERKPTLH